MVLSNVTLRHPTQPNPFIHPHYIREREQNWTYICSPCCSAVHLGLAWKLAGCSHFHVILSSTSRAPLISFPFSLILSYYLWFLACFISGSLSLGRNSLWFYLLLPYLDFSCSSFPPLYPHLTIFLLCFALYSFHASFHWVSFPTFIFYSFVSFHILLYLPSPGPEFVVMNYSFLFLDCLN